MGETSNPGLPKFLRRLRRGISSMSDPAFTVPAPIGYIHVAHRALEGGCVPEVVEMSVDDSKREIQGRLSGNRFEALSDRAGVSVVLASRPKRRLVLLSQNADNAFDHECDPDTKSVEGISDVEDEECPEALALESLRESKLGPGLSHL